MRVLLLPGWLDSGPGHWQTLWEAKHGDRRVTQADWLWPKRGDWMARLEEVLLDSDEPALLVAHSPRDEIVPVSHGRRLYEAAAVPRQWLELAGGHNDGFIFMRAEWVHQFGEFLQRHLPV